MAMGHGAYHGAGAMGHGAWGHGGIQYGPWIDVHRRMGPGTMGRWPWAMGPVLHSCGLWAFRGRPGHPLHPAFGSAHGGPRDQRSSLGAQGCPREGARVAQGLWAMGRQGKGRDQKGVLPLRMGWHVQARAQKGHCAIRSQI